MTDVRSQPKITIMNNRKFYFLELAIILLAFGCNKPTENTNDASVEEVIENQISAICLWNNLSLRESPGDDGTFITSVNLGEKLDFLDSIYTDESSSKKYRYANVKLSDGKTGWIREDLIAIDAQLAVITETASICKRADLLTKTDKSFEEMDVVAVKSTSEGWAEIKGIIKGGTWFTEGWVQESALSYRTPDITDAILVSRALTLEDSVKKYEELKRVYEIEYEDYSVFKEVIARMIGLDEATNENSTANENALDIKYQYMYTCWFSSQDDYNFDYEGKQVTVNGKRFGSYIFSATYAAINLLTCAASSPEYEITGDGILAFGEMSGIAPYTRTVEEAGFNYINPEFAKWATNNLIPDPTDNFLGTEAQNVYNVVIRKQIRKLAQAYFWVLFEMPYFTGEYKVNVLENDMDGLVFLYENAGENSDDRSVWYRGFWARREIDGSHKEIWAGLEKVLILYDNDWYLKTASYYGN